MTLEPHVPSENELEERMKPGALSQSGFLGSGESLFSVIKKDRARLMQLGVSGVELADGLERLLSLAQQSSSRSVTVDRNFQVKLCVYPGFQICPWSPDPDHMLCNADGGARFASIDWTIHNLRTGQTLNGSGLLSHLIRAHDFFEGEAAPYRIDPDTLTRLLELGPYQVG
jgi:hypothetical protein